MGKGRHASDRMYMSTAEAGHYGAGARTSGVVRALPFSCCALSLAPFEHPVMAADGSVFDITQIIPFIRKHGTHPVTGAPLAASELVHLHFARNGEGEYACPVTGKVFNEHTRIAAIRSTGNVFAWDAIQTLCLARRHLADPLSDAPFARADVILLQDPTDAAWLARHDVNTFQHVRAAAAAAASAGASGSAAAAAAASAASGAGGGTLAMPGGGRIRASDAALQVLAELEERERDGSLPTISGAKRRRADEPAGAAGAAAPAPAPAPAHVTGYGVATSARLAGSLTSTGMTLATRNEAAADTPAAARARRWAAVAARRRKAYAVLRTSAGALNVELHADIAPRTVDNFLTLARRGAYAGTPFHRVIRNFMAQTGDPTGTGRGGASAWGAPFADEFDARLSHDGRGVLSMANAGPDSNKSQFFITLRSAPHLDRKHAVFGRVVGGLDALRAIELAPTDAADRPRAPLTLEGVDVIQDPFADFDAEVAAGSGGGAGAGAGASASAVAGGGASIAARVAAGTAALAPAGRVVTPADAAATAAAAAARRAAPTYLTDPAAAAAAGAGAAGGVGRYLPPPLRP